LKASLHLADVAEKPRNQHIVFVDSNKEGMVMRPISQWSEFCWLLNQVAFFVLFVTLLTFRIVLHVLLPS